MLKRITISTTVRDTFIQEVMKEYKEMPGILNPNK